MYGTVRASPVCLCLMRREAADEHERANGRRFREVEFALPTELTRSERLEAAREFAHFLTDRERLPYTLAIHRGGGREPALPPGDIGAVQRRAGADGGDLVQAVQRKGTGAGRGAEVPDLLKGMAPFHPMRP